MQLLRAVFGAGLLLASQSGRSQDTVPTMDFEALEELAEVVVIGEQPGPALWQVKSGDHTLWILGEVSPLPAKATWRSKQMEKILASAQVVIVSDGINDGASRPSANSTAVRRNAASMAERKLPDGKTLKDVLSPETYARFEAAKRRFAKGDKEIERLTPGHANNRLLMSATRVLKLAPATHPVSITVSKLAQRAAVKVVHVDIDLPEQRVPHATKDLPAECQPPEPLLAQLDDGGIGWRALANAWSIGDIGALRVLVPANAVITGNMERCAAISDEGEHTYDEVLARTRAAWVSASERALATNVTSLAVVQMAELFAPEGLVAVLRARGYDVVEPY